jgi:hypothetical protein
MFTLCDSCHSKPSIYIMSLIDVEGTDPEDTFGLCEDCLPYLTGPIIVNNNNNISQPRLEVK